VRIADWQRRQTEQQRRFIEEIRLKSTVEMAEKIFPLLGLEHAGKRTAVSNSL